MKRVLALGLAFAMAVTAVPAITAEAATAPKLSQKSVTVVHGSKKNQTKSITVTVPSTWKSAKVATSSSKKTVATVKNSSVKSNKATVKVTAVKKGTAKVTVKVTGKKSGKSVSKTLTLDVKTVNNGAKITDGDITMTVGDTKKLTFKKTPTAAEVTAVKSSDDKIVTVALDGTVSAVTAGAAKISFTTDYGITSKEITVTVEKAKDPATSIPEITSFEATKDSEFTVKFASAVPTAAAIAIKQAGTDATITGTEKWNADRTEYVFASTVSFKEGTYEVTVRLGTEQVSKTTEVVAEKLELSITSKQVLTDANDKKKGYIYYKIENQYGVNKTPNYSVQFTISATSGTPTVNKAQGKITFTSGNDLTYGSHVYVTGVNAQKNLTVTADLTVGMEQAANSVKLVGFVNTDDPTKMIKAEDGLPANFAARKYVLLYDALDQDGNIMDATGAYVDGTKALTFISSDVMLIDTSESFRDVVSGADGNCPNGKKVYTFDGVEHNAVTINPGMYVDKAEANATVTVSVISNKTGNKDTISFKIGQGEVLKSLVITGPKDLVVADGDQNKVMLYTATTTAGNTTTDYETIVRSSNTLKLSATAGTLKISEDENGKAVITWSDESGNASFSTIGATYDGIDRPIALTTIVVGGESDYYMLGVQDARRPNAIKSVNFNDNADAIVCSGTASVKAYGYGSGNQITYIDQYNETITNNTIVDSYFGYLVDGKSYSVDATITDSDQAYLVASSSAITADKLEFVFEATTTSSKVQNAAVKWTLQENQSQYGNALNVTYGVVPVTELSGLAIDSLGTLKVKNISSAAFSTSNATVAALVKKNTEEYTNAKEMGLDVKDLVTTMEAIDKNIDDGAGKAVVVKGTYNGKKVKVPSNYYVVTGDVFAKSGSSNITGITDGALKLGDFYDANTATMQRKTASKPLTVWVYGTTGGATAGLKPGDNDPGQLTTDVTLSDEKSKAVSIAFKSLKETDYVSAENLKISINHNATTPTAFNVVVKDQYGKDFGGADDIIYTVSEQKEGTGKLTHIANSLKITKNGSSSVEIEGAEITDTFVLTATVKGTSISVKATLTVKNDTQANITDKVTPDADFRTTYLGYRD